MIPAEILDPPMPSLPERAAVLLILFSGMATVLGVLSPEGMGMVPLLGGLTLLLVGSLRRQPLAGGFLVLLMLTLRIHVQGDERYFPAEIALADYLLALIAMAATFRAGREFWRFFQLLFPPVMTASCLAAWIRQAFSGSGAPFGAGILTPPQTALLLGIGFCLSLGHLFGRPRRGGRQGQPLPGELLWLLLCLVNGALLLASDGPRSLLLAGLALLVVRLAGRIRRRQIGGASRHPPLTAALLGILVVVLGSVTALLPGGSTPAAVAVGVEGLGQRLALLRCFFSAAFGSFNRFLYGLGFTNSSTWLCRDVSPGGPMIQADNLLAQVAADNGILTLLALAFLLFLLLRQGWRLSGELPDPVVRAALIAGLFGLLVLQLDAGWARNTFLQALLGLQLGALTLQPCGTPTGWKAAARDGRAA